METQVTLVFFFMVMSSSAAEKVTVNLTGTEGGNITLTVPVKEFGILLFGGKTLAIVKDGNLEIYSKNFYIYRVLWNNSTGLFTLTGLRRNNTGDYFISFPNDGFSAAFNLKVYASVPVPVVNRESESADGCTLLCSVDAAEETTLSWYRDEQLVNSSSSALPLSVTVQQQDFSSQYKCVAVNPAERKSRLINVDALCSTDTTDDSNSRHYIIALTIVSIVIFVPAVFIIMKICFKRTTKQTQDSEVPEVCYSEIRVKKERQNQERPDPPPAAVECPDVPTVYTTLQAHHMVPVPVHSATAENL